MTKHKEVSKEVSAKKVAANQQNAQKSSGPLDSSSTRYNAVKHGLLANGISELDSPEKFGDLIQGLTEELKPCGTLEKECVQQIALLTMRVRRARTIEAEILTAHLNPAKTIHHPGSWEVDVEAMCGKTEIVDPGLPAAVPLDLVEKINQTIGRYETATENRLFRWHNHLERLQRIRRGEPTPSPATVDVNVHQTTPTDLASFGNVSLTVPLQEA